MRLDLLAQGSDLLLALRCQRLSSGLSRHSRRLLAGQLQDGGRLRRHLLFQDCLLVGQRLHLGAALTCLFGSRLILGEDGGQRHGARARVVFC